MFDSHRGAAWYLPRQEHAVEATAKPADFSDWKQAFVGTLFDRIVVVVGATRAMGLC
jgi:hypothetical protein